MKIWINLCFSRFFIRFLWCRWTNFKDLEHCTKSMIHLSRPIRKEYLSNGWLIVSNSQFVEKNIKKIILFMYFVRIYSIKYKFWALVDWIHLQSSDWKRSPVFMIWVCSSLFLFWVFQCSTLNTACNQSNVSNISIEVFRGVQLLKGSNMHKNNRLEVVNQSKKFWIWKSL